MSETMNKTMVSSVDIIPPPPTTTTTAAPAPITTITNTPILTTTTKPTPPPARVQKPKSTAAKKRPRIENENNKDHDNNDDDNAVFCLCRKPDDGTVMIGCDYCDEWFHASCIKFTPQAARLVVSFSCPNCTRDGRGETKWKRHCRLPGCKEVVTKPNKFCTKDHGVKFYKDMFSSTRLAVPKGQVRDLVESVKSAEEFKSLGEELNQGKEEAEEEGADTLNETDKMLINEYTLKAQQSQMAIESWKRREAYAVLTKDQTKRLNELAAQDAGVKKKDLCGYDYRLSYSSAAWSKWEASDDAKSILSGETTLLDSTEFSEITGLCIVEKRKCLRHMGWQLLSIDECKLEQHTHQAEIDEMDRKINDIQRLRRLSKYLVSHNDVQFL